MNIRFIIKIIALLSKNIDKNLTILQISKKTGLSYNATYRTTHALKQEGVIKLIQIGSASVAQLLDSTKTKGFVALAESYSKDEKNN